MCKDKGKVAAVVEEEGVLDRLLVVKVNCGPSLTAVGSLNEAKTPVRETLPEADKGGVDTILNTNRNSNPNLNTSPDPDANPNPEEEGDRGRERVAAACLGAFESSAEWLWVPGDEVLAGEESIWGLHSLIAKPGVEAIVGLSGWVNITAPGLLEGGAGSPENDGVATRGKE
ncbi:unnamed protein product, partial [Discosporangium mesarthrocarpum]